MTVPLHVYFLHKLMLKQGSTENVIVRANFFGALRLFRKPANCLWHRYKRRQRGRVVKAPTFEIWRSGLNFLNDLVIHFTTLISLVSTVLIKHLVKNNVTNKTPSDLCQSSLKPSTKGDVKRKINQVCSKILTN